MNAWAVYFKERFPLPVYLLLVGGFAASGTVLGCCGLTAAGNLSGAGSLSGAGNLFHSSHQLGLSSLGHLSFSEAFLRFCAAFFGLMVFFSTLRMMDEVKDFEKDKIANPGRPLPRGILSVFHVAKVVAWTVVGMFTYGAGLAFFSAQAALVYVFLTAWLWLMYREFYVPEWLGKRQLIYATSHQFVLVPVSLLPIVLSNPQGLLKAESWLYAALVVGSFFSYEICRKLNPKAHPILLTYRYLYGVRGCFGLVCVTTALAVFAAWKLQMAAFLWPISALLLMSFTALKFDRHKLVETVATLSLAVHIWSIFLTFAFWRMV